MLQGRAVDQACTCSAGQHTPAIVQAWVSPVPAWDDIYHVAVWGEWQEAQATADARNAELDKLRQQALLSAKERAALKTILDAKMRPLVAGVVDSLMELAPEQVGLLCMGLHQSSSARVTSCRCSTCFRTCNAH